MQLLKIPPYATLVHHGPLFDVYQRQQEMFDGSYKTFERVKRRDIVKVLLTDWQHIVMTQEEQPGLSKISFPWGFVEEWEDLPQAAKREVLEETGYEINTMELLFSLPYRNDVLWARYYYLARTYQKIQEISLDPGGERITLLYKTFDEFLDYLYSDESYDDFAGRMMKNYIVSWRQNDLKKLLFW